MKKERRPRARKRSTETDGRSDELRAELEEFLEFQRQCVDQREDQKFFRKYDKIIRELQQRAQHDATAARMLFEIAKLATHALGTLPLGAQQRLARSEASWPMLVPAKFRSADEPVVDHIARLKVGSWLSISPAKLRRTRTPARAVVVAAVHTIERCRGPHPPPRLILVGDEQSDVDAVMQEFGWHDWPSIQKEMYDTFNTLPELTTNKESLKAWSLAIRRLVTAATDGEPEKHRLLCPIGRYRQKHRGAKPGSGTEASDIRDGIFDRLATTLRNVVRDA